MNSFSILSAAGLISAAFLLATVLTRRLIKLGPRLGLMDEPDERRVHVTPIPRAGGIAIWISFIIVAWLAYLFHPGVFSEQQVDRLIAFSFSSALLMLVGIIDDRSGMKALVKLAGQVGAALVYFILDPSLCDFAFLGFQLPWFLACVIFVGWSVLLINAFNLIDGLDGLCSGLVIVSLAVVAGLAFAAGFTTDAVMGLTMLAAVLGFIRYNLNPAKIFLGDAGSMMLGFYLATVATQVGGERALVGSIMLPIAIAGIPLLDVLLAVWRRSARNHLTKSSGGEKVGGIFSPDKDHLHHRFLELGLTQRRVAFILQGVAVILAGLCFVPMIIGGRGLVITFAGLLILGLFGIRHFARVELLQSGSLLHLVIKRRKGKTSVRAMYYIYDVIALVVAAVAAVLIETNVGVRDPRGLWSLNFVVLFVLFQVITLQSLRIYRRIWSRPALREFFLISAGVTVCGFVISYVWAFSKRDVTWADFRCGLLGSQIAMWLVLTPRALPEIIRELAVDSKHRKLAKKCENRKQVLVYGAGMRGNLFVEFLKNCNPDEFNQFQIAGFLDDNRKLHRRTLQGFKIYGDLDHLEELVSCHELHGIMVTITDLPGQAMERVFETARRLGLTVYQWEADGVPTQLTQESLLSGAAV
ncbi:hypothetical protein N9891_00620 [bacterium]|nr:hypothetical protein [bacterium]